jgi:hypothetical protein
VALPVTGECELINAEITAAGEHDAAHVAGWISHAGDVIEVLDVTSLTAPLEEQATDSSAASLVESSS